MRGRTLVALKAYVPVRAEALEARLSIPEFFQGVSRLLEDFSQSWPIYFLAGMDGDGDLTAVRMNPHAMASAFMAIFGPALRL